MSGVLKQNSACKGAVRIIISCLVGILICHGVGADTALSSEAAPKLSKKEKRRLVERGVAAYEKGRRTEAKTLLEQAKTVFAENYAVPYYLGAIYLTEGQQDAAISEWQRYTALDANSENALKIQKFLTLLRCDRARKRARLALAKRSPQLDGAVPENTIAVLPFKNVGYEVFGPLGKGFANLLISDLSCVPDLKLVDRIQTEAMLDEAGVKTSGRIDATSAAKLGGLFEARQVASGYLQNITPENLQIITTLYDVSEKTSVEPLKKEGELAGFYRLEKEIACDIARRNGKKCKKMPEGFHKVHTRSLAALVAYSWGLDYFDQTKYDQAREMFLKALEEDPDFELAEKAMAATPTSGMKDKSPSQLVASAATSGISSTAAGNALAGGQGISKTKMILGGLAVAGGGAALAGASGGGNGPDPPTDPGGVVEPSWTGAWLCRMSDNVNFTLDLQEQGSEIQGSMVKSAWECLEEGTVSGSFDGEGISLRVTSGSSSAVMSMTGTASGSDIIRMSSNWSISGGETPCAEDGGTFDCDKAATGDVEW